MLQPAHSLLLPPSGASIWFPNRCSGSSHAQLHLPDLYSLPAEEGVGAHMHGEACFNLGIDADRFVGRVFNGVPVKNAQIDHVQGYVDLIRSRPGEHRFIELKLSLPNVSKDLFGTLDSGIYDVVTRTLYIDDFKYGFEDVSGVDNYQLWIYAVMLLEYLVKQYGLSPLKVQFGIYQPRTNQGEILSTQIVNAVEVIAWKDSTLRPAVKAALDPMAKRTPGKHCKYCKAKINCPEYGEWSNYVIEPPFPLTDESIVKIMEIAPTVKKLNEEAIAHGTERRQRGYNLLGTKLVRKTKHAILDNEKVLAVEIMENGANANEVYKPFELKSPAQLKKAFKGNKKLLSILDEHTYKPKGGVTIALLNDNRTAIATTQEVFKNVK